MGFFKKIFKGIKKVFKKVGKAIKSAFKSVGKFMGKIGIIGQIGLALVLPGIGAMLGTGLQGIGGALAGYSGIGSSVVNAAGQFITKAVEIGGRVGNFFSSVTDGVTKVIGQTVGAAANSIPGLGDALFKITGGKLDITNMNFFGKDGVWETAQKSMQGVVDAGKNIFTPQTIDSSTLTSQVQEGLQAKIEGGMTTPDVPAPTIEQPSLLSPQTPRPPVGTVTSEQISSGVPLTPDSLSEVAVSATKKIDPKTGKPFGEATFMDKVTATGKELYERGVAEAKEEIAGLPKRAVSAAGTKLLQKTGLATEPEYVTNYTAVNVPSIDMGSTTDIGYGLTTPDVGTYFSDFDQSFLDQHPFGSFAEMMNLYPEEMKARGYA